MCHSCFLFITSFLLLVAIYLFQESLKGILKGRITGSEAHISPGEESLVQKSLGMYNLVFFC